ncbi:MAG: recombinase family protein [Oscillospiraceae bacterium]|nr:recombinase family protein [Oscillospiraceae bacterium]
MSTRIILPKPEESKKKRTAAYCRVSSSSKEQLHSYAAQVKYYSDTLSADKAREFVGVYADEGITGTSAKKRPQFMAMIEDCRAGKIDAIITKSVSRFGRNTVDTLSYTRELKTLRIDVYFEKENLHSISPEGELLLTLMAAFAESESVSMSENISWGFRKRYAEGDLRSLPIHNLYGFDRNAEGEVVIFEKEAKIVRRIYDEFLAGQNTQFISDMLNADGVPARHKGAVWYNKTVINILQNEKYCGDVLFQKTFSQGPLSKCVKNRGELPQYWLDDALPAIIDKKLWRVTQYEYRRRAKKTMVRQCPEYPFVGRFYCGLCGRPVIQYSSRGTGGIMNTCWRCATKISRYRQADDIIHEDARVPLGRPEQVFTQAWNLIMSKKPMYIARVKKVAETDESELTRYHASEMLRLMDEMGKITEFDYMLSIKVLDRMELQLVGKLTVIFLSGIRITI